LDAMKTVRQLVKEQRYEEAALFADAQHTVAVVAGSLEGLGGEAQTRSRGGEL
jgi:hypothetical protein